ncbi:2-succinyl-6-hydroxy-2,4-cyclohexadiene-1-carboxylate synthase [Conexibacter sp. S30A1]|uniref:2-succinyl-6-hydroxy-2, 4-cyclohexadiene-1-carboxylate synthase n=1 Tax=Conexibacter sp. S30A1 TaxID=2937800 RepID=UPI00200D81F9|nr:2-succinyl-6-hydroxy-2,4-cyclohexadiene-1-carboxylate synthase [Conexibacter sp. S30A1]
MKHAPVAVLLHGFTNSGASWQPVVQALGQRYRAITPDIRGHASNAAAWPITLEAVIADITALTREDFTLTGYSQGGRIALHVALALPQRVRRLVLIGASPGIADEAERVARRLADERLAERIERLTIEQFAREWAQTPVLADAPPSVAQAAYQDRLHSTPEGLAAALRGLGTGALPPLWERLGELMMPVTLLAGARDTKFTTLARDMASLVPCAEVRIVPDSGHAVHLERPDAVAQALLEG